MGSFGALGVSSSWLIDRLWARVQSGQSGQDLVEGPGIESWANSICRLCPGGCGIMVRSVDGLPVGIRGNPASPVNRGGLCPAGYAGLQLLYNPDRIQGPMRRSGPPESQKWEAVSWEEAWKMIGKKLVSLRSEGMAHHLAFLDGASRGPTTMIFKQFLTAYGSPNYIRTDGWENRKGAFRFLEGRDKNPGFDIENAKMVLSFGADLFGAESSPVWFSSHLRGTDQSGSRRPSLVQIDSRLSITASKADKWVPVAPGTEGLLALGIAYLIIQEGLYDAKFIEENTFGFEDWTDAAGKTHKGFKTLVLTSYYPEAVSRFTGVSMEDIFFLGRRFAANQPGLAIAGKEVANSTNGFYAQLAIHSLNALVGNLGRSGGVTYQGGLPFTGWPEAVLDEMAQLSLKRSRIDQSQSPSFPLARDLPTNLASQILSGRPYPVELLLLHKSNPVFELTDSDNVKKALAKIPLVVSFSSFLDESSEFAHLVLPDSHYLESWQADFDVPYTPFNHFSVGAPVIEPIGHTKPAVESILKLAQAVGGTTSRSLPFPDYLSVIQWAAKKLFQSGQGGIHGERDEAWMEFLRKRGWIDRPYKVFEKFWQALVQKGGWVDTAHSQAFLQHAFDTPSKKFEFYSQTLKQKLEKDMLGESQLERLKIKARGDEVYLPHHEPPRYAGDEFKYGYYLIPYEISTVGDGTPTNSPLLMEMIGFRQYVRWDTWAEINPETARRIGVSEGDWIWIESAFGKVKVLARIFAGAQPDAVNIPVGLGHTALGRFSKNRGVNPLTLLAQDFDMLSGAPAKSGTRVNIYKA